MTIWREGADWRAGGLLVVALACGCFTDNGPGEDVTTDATDPGTTETTDPSSTSTTATTAGPTSDSDTTDTDCPAGALGCVCDLGDSCDSGLMCQDGACVAAPVCGDGVQEGDEACDDGNEEDGDGCNAGCLLGGQLLWSATFNGAAGLVDMGYDVAAASDGAVFPIGDEGVGPNATVAWLGRFDPDASATTWEWRQTSDAGSTFGNAVALDDVGAIVYAAGDWPNPDAPDERGVWIAALDAGSGMQLAEGRKDDMIESYSLRDIAVASDGGLLAAGSYVIGSAPTRQWIAKFEANLTLSWERKLDDPGDVDAAAVGAVPLGDGAVFCGYGPDPNTDDGLPYVWVARTDAMGEIQWQDVYYSGVGNYIDATRGCAPLLADGPLLVVSSLSTTDAPGSVIGHGLYSVQLASGTLISLPVLVEEPVDAAGVAVDAAGRPVTVGDTPDAAAGFDAWLRKYDEFGAALWTAIHDGPIPGGFDGARGVAIGPGGQVVVVGSEDTLANGVDLWVAIYSP
ncbi:MAG: DUF4215 domain-containing protein [Myxococcales bacterium]|nr:DUF4215 domain-containing protein [Myxococcales bacterium]